ncbi:MAG: zinc transporter ZupT [Candidatus Heimdallarchaeota archaeon]|nr:MAG: zinc transporter ZupT [Candidatus Heimdallarchaeota archaeon]
MATTEQILWGLSLSLFAGLSTTLGAILVFIIKKDDSKIISLSMGFSAGVMLGVSIFELLPEAIRRLEILTAGFFFLVGMIIVAVIDFLIPHEYMHEHSCEDDKDDFLVKEKRNPNLMRTGFLVAIGIGIHNLPEGFVTITGSLYSLELGLILAIAIALHNIPEGLSVAIPIYAASNNRRKAFLISFISGLAEPIGALIGLVILLSLGVISEEIIIMSLAFVAGIMTFISLDELLPTAHATCNEYGNDTHIVTGGILAGMVVMLITLIFL